MADIANGEMDKLLHKVGTILDGGEIEVNGL